MVELYTYTWVIHWAMEIEDLLKNLDKLPDQDSAWTLPDAQETTQLHAQLLIVSAEKEGRPSLAPSIGSGRTAASSFAPSMQTSINLSSQGSDLFDVECLPSAGLGSSVAQLEPEGSSSTQSLGKTAPMDNGPSLLLERLSQVSNHGLSRNEKLSAVLQLSNTFLDIPVQPLARQITKHAWDIFASMQPRDLLRYVMTPRDPKNPDARPLRNVENPVTKAVNFSNYLSNW